MSAKKALMKHLSIREEVEEVIKPRLDESVCPNCGFIDQEPEYSNTCGNCGHIR